MTFELEYTTSKKIPYITIPSYGTVSFVHWSKDDVGYKHMLLSFNHGSNLSFLTDANMNIVKNEYKRELKRLGIFKNINKLGTLIKKHTNKENIFPYVKLDKLAKDLAKMTFDIVDTKPKDKVPIKRTRRKKTTKK